MYKFDILKNGICCVPVSSTSPWAEIILQTQHFSVYEKWFFHFWFYSVFLFFKFQYQHISLVSSEFNIFLGTRLNDMVHIIMLNNSNKKKIAVCVWCRSLLSVDKMFAFPPKKKICSSDSTRTTQTCGQDHERWSLNTIWCCQKMNIMTSLISLSTVL